MAISTIQKPYSIMPSGGQAIAAEEDNKITWKVSGAIQTAFSIEIKNNSDGSSVLSIPKTQSYNMYYVLPKNSLTNGNEFKLYITVYDANDNLATSDPVIFQTSARPIVTVDPIGTVESQSYNFTAIYTQSENIPIKSYMAILYNNNKIQIASSGILTTTPIEYMFSNLQSENSYYIEFQVTSTKGLTASSGLIPFDVLYTSPQVNVSLTAENTDNAGIKISMNVIQIIGEAFGTISFPDNTNIDLTEGKLVFQDGFTITDNFTLKLWVKSPISKKDILLLSGSNGKINIFYDVVDRRFHLTKTINGIVSSWVSAEVLGTDFFLYIQQIDSNFNIHAEQITS